VTTPPPCPILLGVIDAPTRYVENVPVAATVLPHPYLRCFCSDRIWHGMTVDGAPILVCRACNSLIDQRRVS
jgi:hypothetical protein